MKIKFVKCISVLFFCSLSFFYAEAEASEDPEKLRFEILSQLISQGGLSLKGKQGCESFAQSKQETVGRFMAWSLSFYSKDQANSVEVKCDKRKNDETCSVNFYADSKGESPWSCGLRFLYKPKKKQIQSSSIECIGTC